MDAEQTAAHKEHVRVFYNQHVNPTLDTREALNQRAQSSTYPLKRFHNDIKRQLLLRFCRGKDSLLDVCCGRGGDIQKWNEAGLKRVRGVDISDQEVQEARRRYEELRQRQRGKPLAMHAEFLVESDLGEQPYHGGGPYDVVTCMFAMHYFFEAEARLRIFLRNVSANLKPGGYFIGTIPDAKRVLWHMGPHGRTDTPMLKLAAKWEGSGPVPSPDNLCPSPFGHRYSFAVVDTVTSGTSSSEEGSIEFLAFTTPILRIAAHYGMVPVVDYDAPALESLLEPEVKDQVFKYFFPQFGPEVEGSLAVASSIFVAFVFRKLLPGEELPLLVPPLPKQIQPHMLAPPADGGAAPGVLQQPLVDAEGPDGGQACE